MSECFDNLGNIKIDQITSLHSNASARVIINRNFQQIKDAIICVSNITIQDLQGLILPDPPQNGMTYEILFDGTNYVLVESKNNSGTKYIIQPEDNIKVLPDYQYIVHDYIFIYGTLDVEGELIIL